MLDSCPSQQVVEAGRPLVAWVSSIEVLGDHPGVRLDSKIPYLVPGDAAVARSCQVFTRLPRLAKVRVVLACC